MRTCLISSCEKEIDFFTKNDQTIMYIISDISRYERISLENIKKILALVDMCIIGETLNYADSYINKIKELADSHGIRLRNYHQYDILKSKIMLREINVPIVFISSLLPNMMKGEIILNLDKELSKKGLSVLSFLENRYSECLDYPAFPFYLLQKDNPITEFNHYFQNAISRTNPDIVLVGVPGGILSDPEYNLNCDYGLLAFILTRSLNPSFIINCIFQNTCNEHLIPNVFFPYEITLNIKINQILDMNEYDFYNKNRTMCIDSTHKVDSKWNLFNETVYLDIAEEVMRKIHL